MNVKEGKVKVPFSTLDRMNDEFREEMTEAFLRVYDSGMFIRSTECSKFESEFASFCGANHSVGVASGLDALIVSLRALRIGPGDDVVLPSNTFIATALAVSAVGANVVLVDPDETTFNMTAEGFLAALTPHTKAVIPVHLYGQPAEIEQIATEASKRGIILIEDCAQAHGALYRGRHVGTFGAVGCFSFYPGKNMGALGDGGGVITNDEHLAESIREISNYGSRVRYHHEKKGLNSRLDEMQAAFLRVKLRHLVEINDQRRLVAQRYCARIVNPLVSLPVTGADRSHVWHIFAVRCEDRGGLRNHLRSHGIEAACHYPVTIADQEAYSGERGITATPMARRLASTELSLPLFYGMTEEEADWVIECVNSYRGHGHEA